jgi:urease accessory protein
MEAALDVVRTPARPQRARGVARIALGGGAMGGGTPLARLYQEGSAKVRFCAVEDGAREAVLINTAGGLAGGDRFDWSLDLAGGARCRAITQACEKVYRAQDEAARVKVALTVGAGASLEWLPQETILFDGSRLERAFDIRVEPGGRLLAVEAAVLGRLAMGETGAGARLHDRWRVQWGERLIFADDLRLDDPVMAAGRPGLLGGARAFASILLVCGDAEERLEALRAAVGGTGGASAFDGKLFCRIVAPDGLALRRTLVAAIAALRPAQRLPRLWTV